MQNSKLAVVIIAVVGVALGSFYLFSPKDPRIIVPSSTPLAENMTISHPLITVTSPKPSESIATPLTVTGQARGNWFFEGTFPITLVDQNDSTLADGYATAEGEWMTENFVPFTAQLTFEKPVAGQKGTLILKKANASGLTENDDALEIPVVFQ
jgi:hypothetical protein